MTAVYYHKGNALNISVIYNDINRAVSEDNNPLWHIFVPLVTKLIMLCSLLFCHSLPVIPILNGKKTLEDKVI